MQNENLNTTEYTIKLDLTAGEVNYVLHALSQRPFGEVVNLIGKIKSQGDSQFASLEQPSNSVE